MKGEVVATHISILKKEEVVRQIRALIEGSAS
jgi:hypothetical protein